MRAENQGFAYRDSIDASGAGSTVLEFLVARYRHSTAAEWAERIRNGQVLIDGAAAHPGNRLRAGQQLVWERPPWREPEVPLDFAVLARDADVLAVAKPSGLPTVPAGGFLTHTLLARVRGHFPEATPMHRLGRGTSGIVLFARSARARSQLALAWREGRVERIYRGLVEGRPKSAEISIDLPIGPVPHPVLGSVHGANAGGRPSRSLVRVLKEDDRASLVEIEIATGRPDQIRIHLAAVGHPLVGDPLYGPGGLPRPDARALPGDGGYLLHAIRVAYPHPASGERVDVECAPPAALRL